jgi:CHAD domain-containing protein
MRTSSLRGSTALLGVEPTAFPIEGTRDCAIILQEIARRSVRAIGISRQAAIAGDPDAIHKMRIELTKVRAAALFFRPWLFGDEWQRIDKELDWLNSVLGRARNRDVTVEYAERKPYRRWAGSSRRKLQRRRGEAHGRLTGELRSSRYIRLMSEVDRWLKTIQPREDRHTARSGHIDHYCEQQLRTWRQELFSQGRHINGLGRKQLHQLRIQSKDYRYVVESLLDLDVPLSREDLTFCETAKRVQQSLGDLRDLKRLRRSIGRRPPHFQKRKRRLMQHVEQTFRHLQTEKDE